MTRNDGAAASNTAPEKKSKSIISRPSGRPVGQSDWLTIDELTRVVQLPDRREKMGLRDYAVLLILANTPMRQGEIARLNLGNLLDEGGQKYISYRALKKRKSKDVKTGEVKIKQRPYWLKIPVDARIYDGIMRYVQSEHKAKRLDPNLPLFLTMGSRGNCVKQRLTPKAIMLIVRRYVKMAGITKRVTPHSFRATFTTIRLEDHDIRSVQALGGWASLRSVQPYAREVAERVKAAALSHVVS